MSQHLILSYLYSLYFAENSRTAYPQFKRYPSDKELQELYTPTIEEKNFVPSRTKSKTGFLGLMVMLKSFQRLGYFTHPELVPPPIVIHLRSCLELDSAVSSIPSLRSIRYYQEAIRTYLQISPYNNQGQKLAAQAISQAAEVKDHPADLINVAIEELVRQRYELPAFSTLDRLVGHIRSIVNTRLFKRVARKLSPQDRQNLDNLLVPQLDKTFWTSIRVRTQIISTTRKIYSDDFWLWVQYRTQ